MKDIEENFYDALQKFTCMVQSVLTTRELTKDDRREYLQLQQRLPDHQQMEILSKRIKSLIEIMPLATMMHTNVLGTIFLEYAKIVDDKKMIEYYRKTKERIHDIIIKEKYDEND
jgi:hypothetical protein